MVGSEVISEESAVKLAGVSPRTLRRFSEAGYLSVQTKGDGERYYLQTQLHEIFGSFQEPKSEGSCATDSAATAMRDCGASTSSHNESSTYYTPVTPTAIAERAIPSERIESQRGVDEEAVGKSQLLSEELSKLKNLVTLQERILDMKDSELKDLRSQRDWLRARVEKLEDKGDRDQILLLSETQAIRQLIGLQHKPRSTVRNILEWFGLSGSEAMRALPSPEESSTNDHASQGATIVMNKAANA